MCHTGQWPEELPDLSNKKIAIIGQGATGVQVAQELTKKAAETTVFLRTPNTAIPMVQRKLSYAEQDAMKGALTTFLTACRGTFSGFFYTPPPGETDSTKIPKAERDAFFEELYKRGGFNLLASCWADSLTNPAANRLIYDFWAEKTRARISDPVKRDLLAPLEPLHPIIAKRPSLEQDYYECMDKPNVKIVDMKTNDIAKFTEKGIVTADGTPHTFDLIVLATGFDNYTGSFHTMGLRDRSTNQDLREKWKDGVKTYGGLMVDGYPNMWMIYGPQAPTAIGNGPVIIETQVDIVVDMIRKMREEDVVSLEPRRESAERWAGEIQMVAGFTLLPQANR
jgi:cation diffusion facilitator CzcD-associated flavoprotein CzcO